MNRRDAIKTCTAAIASVIGGLPLVGRMIAKKPMPKPINFPGTFSKTICVGAVDFARPYPDMTVMVYSREWTDAERIALAGLFQRQIDSGKIAFAPLPRWKIVEAEA